jgi:hypothetical protein
MDQSSSSHHVTHNRINLGLINVPRHSKACDDLVDPQSRAPDEEDTDALKQFIYPDDAYTVEGVYWADLPLRKQLAFNYNVDNAEIKKELSSVWSMMTKNPLSPVGWYFRNAVIPGAGLGLEGSASI